MFEEIEESEQEEEEKEEELEEEDNEKVLLESESKKTPDEIASFLRGLSDQVEKRSITMKQGGNLLTLTLPENLVLEVEVEEEGEGAKKKQSLEIEIEWYEEDIAKGALELE
ncbi:MAG: amphi-Trp domain-containing protein [Candidatus Heimdallarchaeota archaeon]|nr:MAG: amphi-Trp domain-containing protein [Candidatus Heimdallarchaeota archaeon]